MCQAVTCAVCGKVTWAGCGQHVDEVMRDVPAAQRCPGHDGGADAAPRVAEKAPGLFARLRGR